MGGTKKGLAQGKRARPTPQQQLTASNDNRCVYPYTDEAGEPLFRVIRPAGKKRFYQERYEDGHWVKSLGATRRVLYRLPEVIDAAERHGTVFISEGERDADALKAQGVIATTNPGGAGKWRDDYSRSLVGVRRAIVVWDRDEPDKKTGKLKGQAHALEVAASLERFGVPVRFRRALEGNDASDHRAAGHELHELVEERPGPPLPSPESVAADGLTDGSESPLPAPLQLAHRVLVDHALAKGLPAPRPWSEGVGWEACCPAHDDRNASLSIGRGDSRPVVAWCHAGCELPEIAAALGIRVKDFSDTGFERSSSSSNSWAPVDLELIVAGVLAGEIVGPVPTLLARTDGRFLLYPGEVHSLSGEPETCKGWIALSAAAVVMSAGGNVLYYDFEDSVQSIIVRLIALGADPAVLLKRFTYIRPADPFSDVELRAVLDARRYAFAVIDGLTEAYSLLGLGMTNEDAAKFLARLPRPIADRGTAVLEIDHVVKDKDQQGRWSIGPQHKLAGIAVGYTTQVLKAPSRQRAGKVKLKLAKDRHGHVGPRGDIALVEITPEDDGQRVRVVLNPPDGKLGATDDWEPTELMERTSNVIKDTPGLSKTEVRRRVGGNQKYGFLALKLLIDGDYVEVRHQGRQKQLHYHVRPYPEVVKS